ncbi:NAD(P)-dependent oxidoreductase [Nocardia cyriacigeorgica]|uniref:NAD(P)-dependent oxidoreductase n=1 Tax=Nocardia cyriacigeorgica TaxID=135487 RepID=UPI0024567ECA|nr:NAD(P)-binding domain-containing protein [Nocardia cyriacigeorgica]
MSNPAPVSVIGLGQMGATLASAFLAAGHPTTVWNRSASKAEPLVAQGATRAETLAEAITAGRLIIVCVADYDAVSNLLEPVADQLAGRVLVNLTSGTPAQAREMAQWAEAKNADYLDGAAMSGTRLVGKPEALFLFSGAPEAFDSHRATLSALGNATMLGADPGLTAVYDTALFSLAWGALAGFYQAVALTGAEGVDATTFAATATGHLPFIAGLFTEHARQIDTGTYPNADGTVEAHAAAMEHVVTTSREQGLDSTVPELFTALMHKAIAGGHGSDGMAAVIESIKNGATTA